MEFSSCTAGPTKITAKVSRHPLSPWGGESYISLLAIGFDDEMFVDLHATAPFLNLVNITLSIEPGFPIRLFSISGITAIDDITLCPTPQPIDPLDPIVDPVALEFEAESDPQTCKGKVEWSDAPLLLSRVQQFELLIKSYDPGAHFEVTSAYRPASFQAHLYSVKKKYDQCISGLPGVVGTTAGTKPKLEATSPLEAHCQQIVDEVNAEIALHCLIAGKASAQYSPQVNPPGVSLHEEGVAADIVIGWSAQAISSSKKLPSLDKLGLGAKLFRPCSGDDVHWQFVEYKHCQGH
jgi:hypothetical protein